MQGVGVSDTLRHLSTSAVINYRRHVFFFCKYLPSRCNSIYAVTPLNDACYPITVVGVTLICQILAWQWPDSLVGERCRVSFIGGHKGVSVTLTRPWRDLQLCGRGVWHPKLLKVAVRVINMDVRLDDECPDQHWNPIRDECWHTNIKSMTRVMTAGFLYCLTQDLQCLPTICFTVFF